MAAGLITMHKDGRGAASGIVGVAVPSNEHCETMRHTDHNAHRHLRPSPRACERSRTSPPLIFEGGMYGCRADHHA